MENEASEEEFNPSTLKLAQLRGVLHENGVEYPSNAKKKDLLALYDDKISKKKSKSRKSKKSKSDTKKDNEVLADVESEGQSSKSSKPKKEKQKRKSKEEKEKEVVQASEDDNDASDSLLSTSPFEEKFPSEEKKSPAKGNVFGVDSDSESDLFPSKRKHKREEASEVLPPKKTKKPRTSKKHKQEHKPTAEEEETTEAEQTPTYVPENSATDIKNESVVESEPVKEEKASETEANEYQTQHVLDFANKTISGGDFSELSYASASDNAHSFDSALAKLKKEETDKPKESKVDRDAELGRLLGLDFQYVKPKAKGRRSITPRRPIVISEKRLVSNPDSFVDDSTENETSNLEPPSKPMLSHSFDKDEEAETDIEEEEVEEKEKPQSPVVKEKPAKKRRVSGKKLSYVLQFILLWIAILGTLLFGYWYREQTFLVGYCGKEIYKPTIPDTAETPEVLVRLGEYLDDNFRPQCVPCPQHARCFSNLELGCYEDFVEYKPWYYDIFPIDPYAKKCVPDSKKAEKAELMIQEALDLLRARNADKNCGRTPLDSTEAGIEVNELHDLLLALKAPYITEEEFEELWDRSVLELEKEPEITVQRTVDYTSGSGFDNDTFGETHKTVEILRSTSLSQISLKCHLSNTLVKILMKNKLYLAGLASVVILSLLLHHKYKQHTLYIMQVDTIYNEVLKKLQKQAKTARGSTELTAFIGSIQLRDLILSSERNLARKMRLWEAVSRKVDRNTNVKHSLLEIHGEVMKVWEWISPLE